MKDFLPELDFSDSEIVDGQTDLIWMLEHTVFLPETPKITPISTFESIPSLDLLMLEEVIATPM